MCFQVGEDDMSMYVCVFSWAPLQLWCANWWRSCRSLLRGSKRWCSSPVSPAGRRSPPEREQTHESWSSLGIPRWTQRNVQSLCRDSAHAPWIRSHTHTLIKPFYSSNTKGAHLYCKHTHWPLEVEAEVSEDGSTGQEGAAHAGEQVPVCPIGWAVRLRHVIGLLDHLTVHLKNRHMEESWESVFIM